MLSITQPLRSTPTAGLEALLGWPPLALYAQERGLCTFFRIKSHLNDTWNGLERGRHSKGHIGRWSKQEEIVLSTSFPKEKAINKLVWVEKSKPREGTMPMMVYTDASKEGNRIGYSWIASIGDYSLAHKIFSAREMNIYQAEMLAIKEPLE